MKRILTLTLLAAALLAMAAGPALRHADAQQPLPTARTAASPRVEALLAAMTLEEKAGQMTQLTIAAVAAEGGPARDSIRVVGGPTSTFHVTAGPATMER